MTVLWTSTFEYGDEKKLEDSELLIGEVRDALAEITERLDRIEKQQSALLKAIKGKGDRSAAK